MSILRAKILDEVVEQAKEHASALYDTLRRNFIEGAMFHGSATADDARVADLFAFASTRTQFEAIRGLKSQQPPAPASAPGAQDPDDPVAGDDDDVGQGPEEAKASEPAPWPGHQPNVDDSGKRHVFGGQPPEDPGPVRSLAGAQGPVVAEDADQAAEAAASGEPAPVAASVAAVNEEAPAASLEVAAADAKAEAKAEEADAAAKAD
jgi:hypothetical protein